MTTYPISTTAIVSDVPKDGQVQWRRQRVQLRAPREDEILVRIIASGICHTDLVLSSIPPGAPGSSPYPKILGHEGAGFVEQVGSAVTHVKEGDKVLLSFDYCGKKECRACTEETPGYCGEFHAKNIFSVPEVYQVEDGGPASGLFFGQSSFSSLALVKGTSALNVSQLVKNEEELRLFAPMGCGYQTGAAAVTELADVTEHDTVAIFGLGGVGMAAIMAAKIRGAKTIIGVDRVQSRLDLAREIGATHVIDTSNLPSLAADLNTAIREIVPLGTNANFDTTGVVPIIDGGLQSLHSKGQMILIGIVNGKSMDLDLGLLLNYGSAIRGCLEGNAKPSKVDAPEASIETWTNFEFQFVPQMIEWYREGKFPIEKLSKTYSAEDFDKALAEMHNGVTIKPILLWSKES
ncbi:NAD(P)-binding protein [Cucurbitaria berberidis CBS 394.84]|uniref:NAD(P)-binding protein n=1 Tax=Cucurbitaria berberidis CBS 394.84 TaxID=1168544 RepID=A0A9P4GMA4_9PLEO|nr:NAD(P)-binding protein [Cucurbitaria berberidis CBS 394.84]KAF1847645.1 NAD(P)-binding protein [Cucurbitaria berberidis CBS 394.84]